MPCDRKCILIQPLEDNHIRLIVWYTSRRLWSAAGSHQRDLAGFWRQMKQKQVLLADVERGCVIWASGSERDFSDTVFIHNLDFVVVVPNNQALCYFINAPFQGCQTLFQAGVRIVVPIQSQVKLIKFLDNRSTHLSSKLSAK